MLLGMGYGIEYADSEQGDALPLTGKLPLKVQEHYFGAQFTFSTFYGSVKNNLPLLAAKELASHEKALYNPFIICGPPASGKTHLLRAIGNELAKIFDFTEIYLGSIKDIAAIYTNTYNNDYTRGRRGFLQFKCLLIDDLQQIGDHPVLQEELVEVFNHFHDTKRHMVFCCTGRVADYDFLIPELKSRLEWGLINTLKEPDLDVRLKCIATMCKEKRVKLSKEQVLTLAQRFTDLRYLQGIITKFFTFRKFVSKTLNDKEFNQILSNAVGETTAGLEPVNIMALVAEHFQLPVKTLTGNKRDREIVFARQVAMYLCRNLVGCSYPALGKLFGGKDHSTAMYAVNKIERLRIDEQETNKMLTSLKKKCLTLQNQ